MLHRLAHPHADAIDIARLDPLEQQFEHQRQHHASRQRPQRFNRQIRHHPVVYGPHVERDGQPAQVEQQRGDDKMAKLAAFAKIGAE